MCIRCRDDDVWRNTLVLQAQSDELQRCKMKKR